MDLSATSRACWTLAFIITPVISILLTRSLRTYFLDKQIAIINVVDLVSADFAFMIALSTSASCILLLNWVLDLQLVPKIMVAFGILLAGYFWTVTITYLPAIRIARYLLIFHYEWLNILLDKTIQICTRFGIAASVLLIISSRLLLAQDSLIIYMTNLKTLYHATGNIIAITMMISLPCSQIMHVLTELQIRKLRNIGELTEDSGHSLQGVRFNLKISARSK